MPFLRKRWKQKPRMWGSVASVKRSVAENCEKIYGIDKDSLQLATPCWEQAGHSVLHNYGHMDHFVGASYSTGTSIWHGPGVEIPSQNWYVGGSIAQMVSDRAGAINFTFLFDVIEHLDIGAGGYRFPFTSDTDYHNFCWRLPSGDYSFIYCNNVGASSATGFLDATTPALFGGRVSSAPNQIQFSADAEVENSVGVSTFHPYTDIDNIVFNTPSAGVQARMIIGTLISFNEVITDDQLFQISDYRYALYNRVPSKKVFAPIFHPVKGESVTNLPESIDRGGFASDGAWHFAPDSNGEVEISSSIDRINPVIAVHDYSVKTGSIESPTEHLMGHFHCMDSASTNVVTNLAGLDAAVSAGVTADHSVPKGFDTQGIVWIDLALTEYANDFLRKGTVVLQFTPQHDSATSSYLFAFRDHDGRNRIWCEYISGDSDYRICLEWGDVFTLHQFTYNETAETINQQKKITVSWDADNHFIFASLNSHTLSGTNTGTLEADNPTTAQIGAYREVVGDNVFHEIKTYDACFLPYGAYFTGNGSVNTSLAHKDLVDYFDCESLTGPTQLNSQVPVVTGTVTQTTDCIVGTNAIQIASNVNYLDIPVTQDLRAQGCISFWCKTLSTVTSYDSMFALLYDDTNKIQFSTPSSITDPYILYFANGTNRRKQFTWDFDIGNWHFYEFKWIHNSYLGVFVDGLEVSGLAYDGTWETMLGMPTTLRLGYGWQEAIFDQIYITNNPNTPQIPTVNGIPIHVPYMETT